MDIIELDRPFAWPNSEGLAAFGGSNGIWGRGGIFYPDILGLTQMNKGLGSGSYGKRCGWIFIGPYGSLTDGQSWSHGKWRIFFWPRVFLTDTC